MSEQVTYEEANPFSKLDDESDDTESSDIVMSLISDIEEKTWRNAMKYYGATEVDENTVKWEFKKTKENAIKTDPAADYGQNVVKITIERFEKSVTDDYEENVLGMRGEFHFTVEILTEDVTIGGKTDGGIRALVKVFNVAENYDFYHHFKTDVPQEIKDEIFEDEVQSRDWSFSGTDENNN